MVSRIAALSIDAHDPPTLARFWCDVLGWHVLDQDEDGVSIGDGTGSSIDLLINPDVKSVKNRLHLDVCPVTGSDQQTELDRLLALGARPVDVGQGESSWHVLADPEGNEFCLLRGVVQPAP